MVAGFDPSKYESIWIVVPNGVLVAEWPHDTTGTPGIFVAVAVWRAVTRRWGKFWLWAKRKRPVGQALLYYVWERNFYARIWSEVVSLSLSMYKTDVCIYIYNNMINMCIYIYNDVITWLSMYIVYVLYLWDLDWFLILNLTRILAALSPCDLARTLEVGLKTLEGLLYFERSPAWHTILT